MYTHKYTKYTMEIVRYIENDFTLASGVDEGKAEGGDTPVLDDDD